MAAALVAAVTPMSAVVAHGAPPVPSTAQGGVCGAVCASKVPAARRADHGQASDESSREGDQEVAPHGATVVGRLRRRSKSGGARRPSPRRAARPTANQNCARRDAYKYQTSRRISLPVTTSERTSSPTLRLQSRTPEPRLRLSRTSVRRICGHLWHGACPGE